MNTSTKWVTSLGLAAAVAVAVVAPTLAHADEVVEGPGPNRSYLYSGVTTLALSYIPAFVVASESSRYGDKALYIPVAGPWIDLAQRRDCAPGVTCSNETANKVLLVVDGVFQGLGTLDILSAFLFPEQRVVAMGPTNVAKAKPASASFRVVPGHLSATGYGLFAVGTF